MSAQQPRLSMRLPTPQTNNTGLHTSLLYNYVMGIIPIKCHIIA